LTIRCVIYTRVSREEQVEGWSLDAQRDQCLMFAGARGWEVSRVFEEQGRSAKTDLRPAFQNMMGQAALRRFDLIVVHKLDRFSRSLSDVVKNVARLKEAGVGLSSVPEPWLDTTSPQGEVMLYLFAVLAQWDNQNRARETAKGKEARARAGLWNSGLVFGYTTPRWLKEELLTLEEKLDTGELAPEEAAQCKAQVEEIETWLERWSEYEEGDAIPHPTNAAGALLAFNYYSTGTVSDTDVAEMLNEEGYRTSGHWGAQLFGPDTTRPLLQNRFFLGEVQYRGEWLPGRHPAIIPKALFEKCQLVRARRRRRPLGRTLKKRVYPLAGLALCARCETRLRAQQRVFEDEVGLFRTRSAAAPRASNVRLGLVPWRSAWMNG
jgi:site-specific DNA recombinase